jgi:hypothetical protein
MSKSGPIDLLGIDKAGNTVIVEIKREKLPREALTQAIDYACVVSAKFGPLMIFLKRWFAYTKTTLGGMHEYQEEAIS